MRPRGTAGGFQVTCTSLRPLTVTIGRPGACAPTQEKFKQRKHPGLQEQTTAEY